ncbi:MAG: hypothetical protein WCY32_02840 [Burkholderiaceae bacterium]
MSTLITHHDGLDRVVSGVQLIVQKIYAVDQSIRKPRNAAARKNRLDSARPTNWFERMQASFAQSRRDREFEALLKSDPGIAADLRAARARMEREQGSH